EDPAPGRADYHAALGPALVGNLLVAGLPEEATQLGNRRGPAAARIPAAGEESVTAEVGAHLSPPPTSRLPRPGSPGPSRGLRTAPVHDHAPGRRPGRGRKRRRIPVEVHLPELPPNQAQVPDVNAVGIDLRGGQVGPVRAEATREVLARLGEGEAGHFLAA